MIQIRNLTKKYGEKTVLNSINVEFEKGKVYGIVGENGAGKTTFFRCISGLENYTGETGQFKEFGKLLFYEIQSALDQMKALSKKRSILKSGLEYKE